MSPTAALQPAARAAHLRQGLALSAGFHLTLAVVLFGVMGVMRQLPAANTDTGDEIPYHVLDTPPTIDDGGGPPPVPPPADPPDDVAAVVPVDREDESRIPPEAERDRIAPDPGLVHGEGDVSDHPGTGIRPGEGEVDESTLDPNVFVPTDIEPMVVHKVTPAYPEIPRQAGLEGKVVVRVLVGKSGEVRKVEIQSSNPMFDDAALEAVGQWTFRPAIWMNKPVAVWVRIPIVFRMK